MSDGSSAGGWVLAVVGMACVAYGLYRGLVLDRSIIPLVPIGAICTAGGLWMAFRGGK